jgi:HK97 family phage portal protein
MRTTTICGMNMDLNRYNPVTAIKALIQRYSYSTFELMGRNYVHRPTDALSLVNGCKGWPYICASRNAETIAGVPLRLYVRGGTRDYYKRKSLSRERKSYLSQVTGKHVDNVDEITEGHPLLDLLDDMNGEQTRSEVIEGTVLWQEITGDAYWYMEIGPLGVPVAIWPLMSQYVKVVRNSAGELVGYLYGKTENDRIPLGREEVIHFRYPNPKNADYGLSPLEAAFGAAVLLESQQEYEQTMYDSGGMPEVALIVKGEVTEETRKRMYAEWKRKFASKRSGDKFIVMQGDCDVKTFGLPPKDVGVEFTQRFSREEIAAAFGVPMTLLQLAEAAKAGAEAGHYAYAKFTIEPKLRRMAEKITEQLCAKFDERLFVAFDNPVPEDQELRLKVIQTRLNTRMTSINEERAIDGLEPVAWGEEPMIPQFPTFGTPPQGEEEDEDVKRYRKSAENVSDPMNRYERSFKRDLEGYFGQMADEVVKRAGEVLD